MKRILTSTALIAMFATPALADDAKSTKKAVASDKVHRAETVHPPTDRVGYSMPEMTGPAKDAQPTTGRLGEVAPPMSAGLEKKAAGADKPGHVQAVEELTAREG